MSGFTFLELQILSINVLGLASSALNWTWFKWDQQLEKISSFSISQCDELEVKGIDWLKTILSWIVVARFIIDRVSLVAYVANIYTIVTRSRQNLLIFWMVLSFFKDIVLEVVVIVTTFLLWRKRNGATSLLVEFIAEKTICLVISICKWCTTFKWYMKLRRMVIIRRFTTIARRSIANMANFPGRSYSLDDECLDIPIIKRRKYTSLPNLDRLSDDLSIKTNTKSLTTLVIEDINDTNDFDNNYVNELSVAEKSMRILNITAEDVMDARARIQERSYWNEQAIITKTPKVVEEVVAQVPLEKDEEKVMNLSRNKQTAKDDVEKMDGPSRKEDMGYPSIKKEEEKDKNEIIPVKEQISTKNPEDILLIKNNDVTSNKMDNHAKSTESRDTYSTPKKKRKEEKGVAKIVQCPSSQSKNLRNMEVKPCASLVRKLEAKLCSVPVNQKEKWLDRKRHPQVIQLIPTGSDASKKEYYKNSQMSCACHRALRNNTKKNGTHARSINIDDKNVDINGKEFRLSIPIVNIQRSKLDKSTFKYSETYRLKKQIQKWEESCGKQSWGNKALAQTARPSGYAKNDTSDKLSILKCRKSIQTETLDESIMNDSLSERYRLKRQMRSRRSINLRSVYNVASYRERNYTKAQETKMKALETCNNFTLRNTEETKVRKRHDLLPPYHKLSIEEREAIELSASRAYNELTLSEDKREPEVRKEHNSSLNHGRLTKESEVSEMKVLKIYNDPILPEDKQGTERTRGHNLSPSFQQSVDERSASRVRNEHTQLGSGRELHTERKLSRCRIASECEEDVATPTRVPNHLSIDSYYENITIPVHRNCGPSLNDRYARQSLNLREITRNIECTVHPRGIILTNKNLHSQFLENGRFRESQQDIVDDNTASTLHSAFFSKPEIITRIFRRAQTRIDESFPSFPTFWQEDFNTEFICRMNNEMIVCNWDSFALERMIGNDRDTLGDSVLSHTNRDTGGERGHNLCIIFIGRERISSESETVTEDSTTVRSQENASSSVESTRTTNILIFDEDCNHEDSTINDNLPIRLLTGVLRNFDIQMSEGSIRDVTSLNEEYVSNVNAYDSLRSQESNVNNINEESNNERDRISSHINVDDDEIHEIEQTSNSSDNCPDNVNVTSYVSSLKLNKPRDEKYLSTINIHSENENNSSFKSNNNTLKLSDNNGNSNKQFDTLSNKTERSTYNRVFKNSSTLSVPGPSSFTESYNCRALSSCDEKFQKLTELSGSAATLNDQRIESISNLKVTKCDTVPQFRHVETLKLETTIQDSAGSRSENRDEVNEFLAEKLFKMHSEDNLQQDDSFYFTYNRNDDPGTPVSFDDGSLMEEFLNDPIRPFNSSYS